MTSHTPETEKTVAYWGSSCPRGCGFGSPWHQLRDTQRQSGTFQPYPARSKGYCKLCTGGFRGEVANDWSEKMDIYQYLGTYWVLRASSNFMMSSMISVFAWILRKECSLQIWYIQYTYYYTHVFSSHTFMMFYGRHHSFKSNIILVHDEFNKKTLDPFHLHHIIVWPYQVFSVVGLCIQHALSILLILLESLTLPLAVSCQHVYAFRKSHSVISSIYLATFVQSFYFQRYGCRITFEYFFLMAPYIESRKALQKQRTQHLD